MIVLKYGGSSLATSEHIKRVAEHLKYVKENIDNKLVVVVSAMGKTTNNLIGLANEISSRPNPRELDALCANGENISASMLSIALGEIGVKAISFNGNQVPIKTNGSFTKSYIKSINPNKILKKLDKGYIVIITGFQGIDKNGNTTTLGRGGSDTTAVALASVLKCKCEIYTDVEHIFTCDPRIVSDAKPIKKIGYEEMIELALGGAKVLEPRSVELGKKYGIEIYLGKSLELNKEKGTIVMDRSLEHEHISGLTLKENIASVSICLDKSKSSAIEKILELNKQQLNNFDMLSINTNGNLKFISFLIDGNKSESLLKTLEEKKLLKKIRSLEINNLSKIVIAGLGFITHPNLANDVIQTLSKYNIFNLSISEFALSITVEKAKGLEVLEKLKNRFDL